MTREHPHPAIANSHVTIHFRGPHGEQWDHERSSTELPPRPVNVKPHPRGVELGQLIQMLSNTECRTLLAFLEKDFSRVGRKTARRIIRQAEQNLTERSYPKRIAYLQSQPLYQAIQAVPVAGPRADGPVDVFAEDCVRGAFDDGGEAPADCIRRQLALGDIDNGGLVYFNTRNIYDNAAWVDHTPGHLNYNLRFFRSGRHWNKPSPP